MSSGVTSEGGAEPSGAGQHKKVTKCDLQRTRVLVPEKNQLRVKLFSSQALLDLLDQVEDAIMEEELPADPGNKGGQTTNEDITNNSRSPVADTDLTIPSKKTIHVPPFNSFLVLEVYLITSSCWFKFT